MKALHNPEPFIRGKHLSQGRLLRRCVSAGVGILCSPAFLAVLLVQPVSALDGQVGIHDPSTIMECDGKYYTYGTGGTALVSDDGWTWRTGTRAPRTGAAPDVIHIGDRYFQYISHGTLISSKSLDPESPDYGWEDGGIVFGMEEDADFMNPIDPGTFLDPTDGKLWVVYGSYFGYLRVAEMDPETGQRVDPPADPVNVAVNCEAATIIYHEGMYYLLATHGSCCNGANSSYNIRVGRSEKVTGPYIDNMGIDMLLGGGKLVCGSGNRLIGPGHFGLIDEGNGIEKFSLHWEADLDRSGNFGTLDILPLLWKDGWPVAGEHFTEGTYQIESIRTGTALEIAVEGVPVGGNRRRGPMGGGGGAATVIPDQEVSQVSVNWPEGSIDTRMAIYMCQAHQKWTISAVADAGGYLGSPYYKITVAGTDRALAATEDGELVTQPAFTGDPEQLWRVEQYTDGTWRIMPRSIPNSDKKMALSAIGSSFATLETLDPDSEKQRWLFKTP